MNKKRILVFNSIVIVFVSVAILLVLLVACGESPSPTSQLLPTSTVQLLTLPAPATSNDKQPTATLNFAGPSVGPNTATAAVFGNTPTQAGDFTTVSSTAASVSTVVSTISGQTASAGTPGATNLPDTTMPFEITTIAVSPGQNTPVSSSTAGGSDTPIVPTQNNPPPTPPIGISPNPPVVPTQPIAVSPAVINNSASINEQRFQLDLAGYKADASIEYPKAIAGPYATILMFQPYGLYDLDATVTTSRFGIGSRNYKVLADQLALRGFAVVRYTKRGYDASGQTQAPAKDTPIDQLISDAQAAFAQVKANPLVDPRKLILLGEDEGATVAMHLAQAQPGVAGLLLIAPVTDPMTAWHYQTVDAPVAYAHNTLDRNKDDLLSVQEWGNAPQGTFLAGFQNIALDSGKFTSLLSVNNSQSVNIDRDLKSYLEKNFQAGPTSQPDRSDYLTALFNLGDNTTTLAGFKQPVLILQGALDQQVPLSQGADLADYLMQQGNSDHTLIKYPKLGHSLYKLDRGGSDVLGPLDINLDPPNNPINDMVSWLQAHFN